MIESDLDDRVAQARDEARSTSDDPPTAPFIVRRRPKNAPYDRAMKTEEHLALAHRWIEAFNRGDVTALVSLYAEDAEHTSPKLRARDPSTAGKVRGRAALASWWTSALEATPSLRYELLTATASAERVLIEYVRHADGQAAMAVAEAFDVRDGKIVASRVYHG